MTLSINREVEGMHFDITLKIGAPELRRIGADQRAAGLECTAEDYAWAADDIDKLTAEVHRLHTEVTRLESILRHAVITRGESLKG